MYIIYFSKLNNFSYVIPRSRISLFPIWLTCFNFFNLFSFQSFDPASIQSNFTVKTTLKLEKKYAPALDNYGQSCFVRSDLKKIKCVCKTQMMPPPNHQNPVNMHTSIMFINILQNIKAVAPKL
jgi:hypothetical protein